MTTNVSSVCMEDLLLMDEDDTIREDFRRIAR